MSIGNWQPAFIARRMQVGEYVTKLSRKEAAALCREASRIRRREGGTLTIWRGKSPDGKYVAKRVA